jgi:DNA repair protein RecN (Recombination protein N)
MLTQLNIRDYAIVSNLEMEFLPGMTVITGETGAGKSIMLDALGLCLGDRADPKAVRPGSERAQIAASFDIGSIPAAASWLEERDLLSGHECLLRRVITAEGRSRAYINGSASTLQDCAELGALLIDIHSQHAHQSLLRKPVQRQLLDAYGGLQPLTTQVEQIASDWLRARRELELLAGNSQEHNARVQLLAYQVEELDMLALGDGELASLETEEKLLANADAILHSAHQALELCEENADGVRRALQLLGGDAHGSPEAESARELLDSAGIQLTEARGEIQAYLDRVEVNPQRLAEVQARLGDIYDIARKHRVMPEEVEPLYARLRDELRGLQDSEQRVETLQREMETLAGRYRTEAESLRKKRRQTARKLEKATKALLSSLAMDQCRFEVALSPRDSNDPHPHGGEDIEFLISTNPGSAAQSLGKIASGGELSRISLAIQVVTATANPVASMVFDEVDVGIGGAVAEVVGRLLRTLAERAQVLCVTHLPQVAAQGQNHLKVSKSGDESTVEARMDSLGAEEKVSEVARMLGGVKITEQTLAHAREMLALQP